MAEVKLSQRMHALVDMVEERRIADIGCDHAFVPIYLIQSGKADYVVAMDVRKGPLAIADANIATYGCKDSIRLRLSDGFEELAQGEVSCAILAGMGGRLMVEILKRGTVHTDGGIHLILQPQSELYELRKYLSEINYAIVREKMLVEEEKYYTVMRAVPENEVGQAMVGSEKTNEMDSISKELLYTYGSCLIREKDTILRQYLIKTRQKNQELLEKLAHIHTDGANSRIQMLEEENRQIAAVLCYYGENG